MSFQVGDSIGDYQIIGILGAGGMGKVYKVKNAISERVDAMKVLLPNLADDPELADRFIREIKVLASLNHPNIAGLRTAFRQDNQLLMVMEFVEGSSLDERCKAGRIPVADAISYIMQALAALGYAHKHGVIHRDIKPANMMLTPDGVLKLMDFGIAKSKSDKKLTQTGTTMGSLFYMSAEQVQGNELDGRSDLYSIGVSLYEMVTGTRPFQGKSDFDIMIAQLQQAPQPPMQMLPDLPKALNDIIMISLEKEPAKRFQTAEAFSAALGSIGNALNATPVQAAAGTAPMMAPMPAAGPGVATGMVNAQSAPPATITAMGGTVSAAPPTGYTPTANMPTVMAPQAETYQAPPPPPPQAVPGGSKGYRGLYMALGALIVVAVLALAAIQVPKFLKTHANGDQAAQVASNSSTPGTPGTSVPPTGAPPASAQSSSTPGSSPNSSQPPATPGVGDGSAAGGTGASPNAHPGLPATANATIPGASTAANPGRPGGQHSASYNQAAGGGPNGQPAAAGGSTPSVTPGAGGAAPGSATTTNTVSAQQLAELEDLHDKLSVRAITVNQRVDSQRKEMEASGNNLRADIGAAQTRVRMYMDKFDQAMNAKDPEAAKRYMGLAERDIEMLEKYYNIQ